MRRRHRFLVAGVLLAPACSPAPTAHRGRADSSAIPPAEQAGPDATAAAAATSTGPVSTVSAGAVVPTSAPAGPTTTVTLTVPTTPATTTTFAVPVPETAKAILPENDPMAGPTALASWYGDESGSHTANGDRYDPNGLTFAHRSMPFGTQVRFCGPLGCVVATCTDRGPAAWTGKTFDLSRGAFARVAPLKAGVAELAWEVVG